jgi:aminomethyltransferase
MTDRAIPRENYEIYHSPQNPIGYVTSGGFSPMVRKGIGLGLVNQNHDLNLSPGDNIKIKIRNKMEDAKIVKSPFYNNSLAKQCPII